MAFEKTFISGEKLREKWNIDRQQFIEIIFKASFKIPKNKKWLLRPHNPRNFKPVSYAEGRPWPPCRLVGGKIVANFSPPEYDSNFDKTYEYLDQYQYLLKDVAAIERAMPQLLIGFNEKVNVRRAAANEVARAFKSRHPDLTQKEAAALVNDWLKKNNYELYSEKHLIKLIKTLNFKTGNPGRKPKNNWEIICKQNAPITT